jgi:hypothetical protein
VILALRPASKVRLELGVAMAAPIEAATLEHIKRKLRFIHAELDLALNRADGKRTEAQAEDTRLKTVAEELNREFKGS